MVLVFFCTLWRLHSRHTTHVREGYEFLFFIVFLCALLGNSITKYAECVCVCRSNLLCHVSGVPGGSDRGRFTLCKDRSRRAFIPVLWKLACNCRRPGVNTHLAVRIISGVLNNVMEVDRCAAGRP